MSFDYTLNTERAPQVGLIALQSDETIEMDFRRLMPLGVEWMVSRVPSADAVTPETLTAMADALTASAALFPGSARFSAVGYGCTSGTAQIGIDRVAKLVAAGCAAQAVTQPLSALVAACAALDVTRIALLSPYIAPVSDRLRDVMAQHGLTVAAFGSFDEAEEARVVRIDAGSIRRAALARPTNPAACTPRQARRSG